MLTFLLNALQKAPPSILFALAAFVLVVLMSIYFFIKKWLGAATVGALFAYIMKQTPGGSSTAAVVGAFFSGMLVYFIYKMISNK